MGNFNRDRRSSGSGGGRSNGRGFGRPSGGFSGRSSGRSFGGRQDRPQMHQAVCAECGNRCEVPFKPTGDKPVYCSDCFGNSPNYGSSQAREKRSFASKDFDRGNKMFQAVCDECGEECEVPFKPTGDKPVLCDSCFRGGSSRREEFKPSKSSSIQTPGASLEEMSVLKEEIKQLHHKLDKILVLLQRTTPVKEVTVMKAEKAEAPETTEAPKKTPVKKVTKTSAPKKKEVKKVVKKSVVKKPAAKKKVK